MEVPPACTASLLRGFSYQCWRGSSLGLAKAEKGSDAAYFGMSSLEMSFPFILLLNHYNWKRREFSNSS